ncbi:Protein-cysteine N-palmitoyltransferase HHAT [Orchesella cincta]|uniref:Protein-cysteine N-palmitoyltransferase HHAT n=1 Tax=Orchesella cincta TaxID=48709 RepID=A0A1D2NBT2_ORCCI|nr:Protein-cysteine N-palmitoyltransferase HHAT [Orchesella cincta]
MYIILPDIEELKQRNLLADLAILVKKMLRIGFLALLIELTLHFLYFRSLSMTTSSHKYLSLWAICGTVYWLGQFFALKYKVLYGVPTCIAEFDGMEMPPLPRCPSYLHRYSVLWRDFDRGLYRFLVNYIYLPTLKFIRDTDKSNVIPSDVKKLIASFMSFVYVYVWHSLSFDVFVWAALNFLGITIERIGSAIKREIDKRTADEPNRQLIWDFLVEPLVTVPLAAMSILNSSIFCGSMESAVSFSKILWDKRQDNYVLWFLYCFTHTAVAYRIWRNAKGKVEKNA